MANRARIEEFWSHWKHEPNPTDEFKRFRIRMTEVSGHLWDDHIKSKYSATLREKFAIISGTPCAPHEYFQQGGLYKLLAEAKTEFDVANALQFLLWTLEDSTHGNFDHCCRQIKDAFDLSPGIMIQLVRHGNTARIYPLGIALLDEAVVESNLIWLGRYPQVLKSFDTALKLYMAKDGAQYRSMLDSLRFALEQMLQVVLNNQRSLENQKEEFLRWLKQHDVHSSIGNMYHNLLFVGFANYQNDAVKHQEDRYTPAEVEFVLYATGTFLRLIQRLVEQDEATKGTAAV